ncbi:MAG: tol-pal system protein YbgF [Candidatus Dadabacteria bacterium]|nr:MAG: tol-pal system protein YbgF [Candidatus Dadabacteria bacterium]
MTSGSRRRKVAGRALAGVLPALVLLGACAQLPTRDDAARQDARFAALEERFLKLERALSEARATEAAPPAPDYGPRLAELGQQVEALDAQVRTLLGRVDALEKRPAPAMPADRLEALERRLDDLAKRVAALEAKPAAPAPSAASAKPAAAPAPPAAAAEPPKPEAATPQVSAQELYDRAYALYKEGKHAEAREAFQRFIELYPKTDLTDNAHFWIGESYYDQREFEKAILAYDKVVQEFPRGDKVPSALLKQAFAFDAIGDPVDARILLKKLLREHPSSEQAAIARKKLEMLGE